MRVRACARAHVCVRKCVLCVSNVSCVCVSGFWCEFVCVREREREGVCVFERENVCV